MAAEYLHGLHCAVGWIWVKNFMDDRLHAGMLQGLEGAVIVGPTQGCAWLPRPVGRRPMLGAPTRWNSHEAELALNSRSWLTCCMHGLRVCRPSMAGRGPPTCCPTQREHAPGVCWTVLDALHVSSVHERVLCRAPASKYRGWCYYTCSTHQSAKIFSGRARRSY